MSGPDDRELAARAARGDLSAFEALVGSYQSSLYCYLYRMCRNSADAEELTQQAFVKAWQGLPAFRADSLFKTWLFRIGTNLCLNHLSRRKPAEPITEALAAPVVDEPTTLHREKVRQELIRSAVGQLPDDQRAAVMLSIYEEMSYAEVAKTMGKSLASVNALLYRARMNLRQLLGDAHEQGRI